MSDAIAETQPAMAEVIPRLHVGSADAYESAVKGVPGWFVVQAAKDPYHRKALGYTGQGAPREDKEYLVARRGERLILNMIDAEKPEYFADVMIHAALIFIDHHLSQGRKVLVHCNQGQSRAPSLALLYLRRHTEIFRGMPFDGAEIAFKERMCPAYQPKAGIRGYLAAHWDD